MRLVGGRGPTKLVLTLVLGLAVTTASRAAPPAINLRVDAAPPECVGVAELRERMTALPQTVDATQTIEVGVALRADEPTGYLADVVVQSKGRGTQLRSVATRSANCRDLDDALLVLIDALVTGAALDDPAAEKAPVPSPPEPTTPDRSGPPARARASTPGRVSHSASLGAALEFGALPDASALVRLDARLALGAHAAIRVGIGTTPWPSSRTIETASVEFRLTSGRALGCWDFVASRWGYLDACAGLDAGAVNITANGLSSGSASARPAAWAVTQASLGALLGPFVPEINAFFGPALVRDSFQVTDTSGVPHTVYRTAGLRFGAGLAVGARLP